MAERATSNRQLMLLEYYKSTLSGVQDLSSYSMGDLHTITGRKGDFELSILFTANKLNGNEPTMVQITIIPD